MPRARSRRPPFGNGHLLIANLIFSGGADIIAVLLTAICGRWHCRRRRIGSDAPGDTQISTL